MQKDLEIVKELKDKNINRINFFKGKIKEELNKLEIDITDELVDNILWEAVNTYEDNTNIPFVFYLKRIIKKVTNTSIIDKNEYKVLYLYFTKQNERFLSRLEISNATNYPINDIDRVIDNFSSKNDKEIARFFPNYKDAIEQRKQYFHKKRIKNKSLSNYQIKLVGYLVKDVNDKVMSINELARKYDKLPFEIKGDLMNVFFLLEEDDNLRIILEYYPDKKDLINHLFSSKENLLSYINSHIITNKLSKKDVKILTSLERSKYEDLTLEEIENLTDYDNIDDYNKDKNLLLNRLKKNRELRIKARNIAPSIALFIKLSDKELEMLKLLYRYHDNPKSSREMAKELDYKNRASYNSYKNDLFEKIRKSPVLKELVLKLYPGVNFSKKYNKASLTEKNIALLTLLNKYHDNPKSNSEMAILLGYATNSSYCVAKRDLFRKLDRNKDLLEEALKIYPELNLANEKYNDTLTEKDIKLLTLLNENSLNDKEIAKELEFENVKSFKYFKNKLYNKLANKKELREKALIIYPSLNLEKETFYNILTESEINYLKFLNEHDDENLSRAEITKRLGFSTPATFSRFKFRLFSKLRENKRLREDAMVIYPNLDLKTKNKSDAITFTNKEIMLLKEFCLVKNNNLIYQPQIEMAKKLEMGNSTFCVHKQIIIDKVLANIENDANLDVILWPNFLEQFIARDNFKNSKSIVLSKEELDNIKRNDTKRNIINGIKTLEQSIFKDYVSNCSYQEKCILALRLGYFNKRFFSSSEVASLFNISEEEVINLTKDCLIKSKYSYLEEKRRPRKIKS